MSTFYRPLYCPLFRCVFSMHNRGENNQPTAGRCGQLGAAGRKSSNPHLCFHNSKELKKSPRLRNQTNPHCSSIFFPFLLKITVLEASGSWRLMAKVILVQTNKREPVQIYTPNKTLDLNIEDINSVLF